MIGGIENVSSYEEMVAGQKAGPGASSELGQDSFLKLLVAQMQHQDPLNPQGNEEFIAQLAQFTSLEQLMGVNTALGDIYAATTSMNNASMTQLLGRDVTAYSDDIPYDGDGPKMLHYQAPEDVDRMTITIYDADGKVVSREEVNKVEAGEGSWEWDGKDVHGVQAKEGTYTVSIKAFGTNGNALEVQNLLKGMVNEMSYATGAPVPFVDGIEVTIGAILKVETSSTDADKSA
jgi:flagellar basal-body rod modification protein FlgD